MSAFRLRLIALVALLATGLGAFAYHLQAHADYLVLPQYPLSVAVDEGTGRAFVSMGRIGEMSLPTGADVVVLDSATGAALRTVPVVENPSHMLVDTHTGHVLVLNSGDGVSVLDARSGALLGTAGNPGGFPFGDEGITVAADLQTSRIFMLHPGVASGVPAVTTIDTRTGRVVQHGTLGTSSVDQFTHAQDLVVDEQTGRVFVFGLRWYIDGSIDPAVAMLDARTGQVVRVVHLGQDRLNSTAQFPIALDRQRNHVLVLDGARGSLSLLDARTGALLRTIPLPNTPAMAVVSEQHGVIFLANPKSNTVSVLDAATGRQLRSTHVGTNPSQLVLDEARDRVFVLNQGIQPLGGASSQGAGVSVLDAATGSLSRTVPLTAVPEQAILDAGSGHLIVTTYDGSIVILDPRHGLTYRTLTLDLQASAMAVDGQTGHLIVAGTVTQNPRLTRDWFPDWLRSRLPWLPTPANGMGRAYVTSDG